MKFILEGQKVARKGNKYGAIRTELDGYVFDSKAEARRYIQLKQLLAFREITNLLIHPAFDLHVKEIKIGTYKADFSYYKNGQYIIEDVKGKATRGLGLFQWKKKHLKAEYGFNITIIES